MLTGRFARQQRILRPVEFKRVFACPCKISDKHLTLLCQKNDLDYARLGLAIAKRNIKTAVARNRIKRFSRESFRHHQKELAGLDIVVIARISASQLTNQELHKVLSSLWRGLVKKCKK